jgi:hypothetical protein
MKNLSGSHPNSALIWLFDSNILILKQISYDFLDWSKTIHATYQSSCPADIGSHLFCIAIASIQETGKASARRKNTNRSLIDMIESQYKAHS